MQKVTNMCQMFLQLLWCCCIQQAWDTLFFSKLMWCLISFTWWWLPSLSSMVKLIWFHISFLQWLICGWVCRHWNTFSENKHNVLWIAHWLISNVWTLFHPFSLSFGQICWRNNRPDKPQTPALHGLHHCWSSSVLTSHAKAGTLYLPKG